MNRDTFTTLSPELWGRMAAGWDSKREFLWESSKPVGEWLVNRLDVQPGQTLLELAAGMGDCGFLAAQMLGDHGRLISTDFAPSMVEGAQRRAEELGLQNAEFRVLDAQQMDLEDDCVDGVICRWGFMLMGDPLAALRETRRVLRSSGRVCLSVFSTPDKNPWAAVPARTLIEEGLMEAPPPGKPGIFALSDRQHLSDLLNAAGFSEVGIDEVPINWRHDSFDSYWAFLTDVAGAISALIESLNEQGKVRARDAIRDGIADFRNGEEIVLPGVTLNAVAP